MFFFWVKVAAWPIHHPNLLQVWTSSFVTLQSYIVFSIAFVAINMRSLKRMVFSDTTNKKSVLITSQLTWDTISILFPFIYHQNWSRIQMNQLKSWVAIQAQSLKSTWHLKSLLNWTKLTGISNSVPYLYSGTIIDQYRKFGHHVS